MAQRFSRPRNERQIDTFALAALFKGAVPPCPQTVCIAIDPDVIYAKRTLIAGRHSIG